MGVRLNFLDSAVCRTTERVRVGERLHVAAAVDGGSGFGRDGLRHRQSRLKPLPPPRTK